MITIGIMAVIFTLLCAITAVIENAGAIAMWLFDVQTAYYKFKLHRKRRYTK